MDLCIKNKWMIEDAEEEDIGRLWLSLGLLISIKHGDQGGVDVC